MKTKYLELLEKYFNGEMNPDEMADLDQRREKDPGLDEAFKEYEQILDALRDKETMELRMKMKEIREQSMKPDGRSRFLKGGNNWMWLAALLAVVVSFTIIIGLMVKKMGENEVISSVIPLEMKSLENLNKELMKYGIRNHGMTLELPSEHSSAIAKREILFQWSVDSTYNLLLDVIDREGNVVFVSHRPVESPYLFRKKLKGGMYMFRFRDDKETFNLSVIYIK